MNYLRDVIIPICIVAGELEHLNLLLSLLDHLQSLLEKTLRSQDSSEPKRGDHKVHEGTPSNLYIVKRQIFPERKPFRLLNIRSGFDQANPLD